ncbi:hypothetical protein [Streptomyces sp. NRRL F-2580]|uniref:hypothetical protein n=1 Tax=Streptomyces sp. NRRL F-2580 TaxID=1463841 RepID=UPI0004C65C53|nr:hypothetical protein [Streptomyces sp. NRRL F-2580]
MNSRTNSRTNSLMNSRVSRKSTIGQSRTIGRTVPAVAVVVCAAALALGAAAAPSRASGWASSEQVGRAGELVPVLAKDDPQHQARVPEGRQLRVVKVSSPVLAEDSEDSEDNQIGYNGRSYLGWVRIKADARPGEYPLSVTFDYVNPLDSGDTAGSRPYVAGGGTITVAAGDGEGGAGDGEGGVAGRPEVWALGGAAVAALATHGVHVARHRRRTSDGPGRLD